jgi:hypothetical protein
MSGFLGPVANKIVSILGMTALGQKTKATALGVTLASDEDALAVTAAQLPATLGQKTKAASMSMTLASDENALPVTDNAASLTVDSPGIPAGLGQTTMAASMPVAIANNQTAVPGSVASGSNVTEGAVADAAVDTDTTGTLSGKLRGLVKLTVNYLSRFPASLGQKTMAASLAVVLASDQTSTPVSLSEDTLPAVLTHQRYTYGAVHGITGDITVWAGQTDDWYGIRSANDGDPTDVLNTLANVGKYFNGADALFDTTPIWIYIPINDVIGALPNLYGGYRTFSAFVKNMLTIDLAVTLYAVPDKARLAFGVPKKPIGDNFDFWQIATATIVSGTTAVFGPNGTTLNAGYDMPIGWLVIKAVPASDPGGGYWALAVRRGN